MASAADQAILSLAAGREQRRRHLEADVERSFHKVPTPLYRHATPSAPWPWMKFDVDAGKVPPFPTSGFPPGKFEWSHYPQNRFQNWTREQVNRSQMLTQQCGNCGATTVYKMKVFDGGRFDGETEVRTVRRADAVDLRAYWDYLEVPPPSNVRVQALFVEDMTLPILQILGTRFNIEPFFFASSTNWIPSRYQEDPKALEDHITVVLPFIRTLKNQRPITRSKQLSPLTSTSIEIGSWGSSEERLPYAEDKKQIIDTQVPLSLPDDKILLQDLLSLHMIRKTTTSTIITYQSSLQGTSSRRLLSLAQRTGHSVYWSSIFRRSKDPTFHLLAMLWYALYAWDEAFEVLYGYINALESDVLRFNNIKLTRELHKLQAHVLYYQQLLRDFHRSVEFVRDTPNPAMSAPSISKEERESSENLLHTEADNLISEIERLTRQREMLSERLDNVIRLAFATVNIEESKAIQALAVVTMKDSSAIKQIGYLSMVFLPATYMANVFSMNVQGITIESQSNVTIAQYVEAVVVVALFTMWLVVALQQDSFFFPPDSGVLHRALWPFYFVHDVASTEIERWRLQVRASRPEVSGKGRSAVGSPSDRDVRSIKA